MILAKSRRPDFVRPGPVDIDELLTSVLEKVRPLADRNWRIDRTVHAVIELDQQRITQALVQLVSNGVRHSTAGAAIALSASVITVAAADSSLPPVGQRLRLSVRDEGAGIAPEDHQRIFERFARSGPAHDHSSTEGSGLGLAIVDAIAKAHRGQVLLESEPGRGSTFTLDLPIITTDPPASGSTEILVDRADHEPTAIEQESPWPRS
jgi:signal transduction histidine kinase